MFNVDSRSNKAVYEQVYEQLERFILMEIVKCNEKLPSVRELAITLAINPNTIQKAYSLAEMRGLIYIVKGKGSFVANFDDFKKDKIIRIKNKIIEYRDKAIELGVSVDEIKKIIEL